MMRGHQLYLQHANNQYHAGAQTQLLTATHGGNKVQYYKMMYEINHHNRHNVQLVSNNNNSTARQTNVTLPQIDGALQTSYLDSLSNGAGHITGFNKIDSMMGTIIGNKRWASPDQGEEGHKTNFPPNIPKFQNPSALG